VRHEAAVYEARYLQFFSLLNPQTRAGEIKYELSHTRDPERTAELHGELTLLSSDGERELRSSARVSVAEAYPPVHKAETELAAALWTAIHQRHEKEIAEVKAFAASHELPADHLVAVVDQRFEPTLKQLTAFIADHPQCAVINPDQLPLGFLGVNKI
jgi:hypothetical protein